jgi:hypothetical protein
MSEPVYTPEQVQHAYAALLSPENPLGRVVLWDLAAKCHATVSTESETPQQTSFRNGQRAVFLYIAGRTGAPLFGG